MYYIRYSALRADMHWLCGTTRRSQQTLVQFAMLQMKILCYPYPSGRRLPRLPADCPRCLFTSVDSIGRVRKRIADNTWHVVLYRPQSEGAIRSAATCGGTVAVNAIARLRSLARMWLGILAAYVYYFPLNLPRLNLYQSRSRRVIKMRN